MRNSSKSRNSTRRRQPLPLEAKLFLAALIGALFYYLFVAKTEKHESPERSPKISEQKNKRALQTVTIQSRPDPLQNDSELRALRAAGFKNVKFGIQSLALKPKEGPFKIPLSFRSKKLWCIGGDIDTMRLLTASDASNDLLVTIEPLAGNRGGEKFPVSIQKLMDGFDRTFTLENKAKTENLGLYICSDRTKTKSCRDKQVVDHKKLSDRIADVKTQNSALQKDYILYFQNFFVKDATLYSYSNDNSSDEGLKDLKRHLVGNFKLGAADVDTAQSYAKAMRSVPADISGKKITLTLPYNDPRCLPGL